MSQEATKTQKPEEDAPHSLWEEVDVKMRDFQTRLGTFGNLVSFSATRLIAHNILLSLPPTVDKLWATSDALPDPTVDTILEAALRQTRAVTGLSSGTQVISTAEPLYAMDGTVVGNGVALVWDAALKRLGAAQFVTKAWEPKEDEVSLELVRVIRAMQSQIPELRGRIAVFRVDRDPKKPPVRLAIPEPDGVSPALSDAVINVMTSLKRAREEDVATEAPEAKVARVDPAVVPPTE